MQKIQTVEDLKTAIQQLEYEQANDWSTLKGQLLTTVESLKPGNILKGTLKEIFIGPDLKSTIVNAVIGLTSGFVAAKVFAGKVPNPLIKLALSAAVGIGSGTNGSK